MGLKGKISEFAIADIFQLISVQQKSGALEIKSPRGEMVFIFKDGQIVDVTPDERSKEQLIGQILVDGGKVSESDRDRILKVHRTKGGRFGEILVEKGLIDEDTLSLFLTIQLKECVFQALTCKDGLYRFDAYTVKATPSIKYPVRVDQLLLEGMQFLDEFPIVMEKFPAKGLLIKRKEGFEQEDLAKERGAHDIYSMMNEFMEPIKHIRRAGLSELEGYKAIAFLYEMGALLVKEKAVDDEELAKKDDKQRNVRMMQIENVINLLILAAFVGAVVYLFCEKIDNSGIFLILREIMKGF